MLCEKHTVYIWNHSQLRGSLHGLIPQGQGYPLNIESFLSESNLLTLALEHDPYIIDYSISCYDGIHNNENLLWLVTFMCLLLYSRLLVFLFFSPVKREAFVA